MEQKREMRQRGMTLIEVVIFMSLILFVAGSTFPLISRLRLSDKSHEERLAAFAFIQSSAEELKEKPYVELTNGFVFKASDKCFERIVSSTNFYKNIPADFSIRLFLQDTPDLVGDCYRAEIDIEWETTVSDSLRKKSSSQLSVLLFPDIN